LEYRTSCDYEDGELAGGAKKVYLFDEKYNLVRTNVYVDGNIVSYTKYTYDARGNRIKSESHSYENGSTVITQYTYDDKCNLVKTASGNVVSTYSYDANNRLVKQTWQDSIAKYVCRYNYDTKGNIIGEMVYENDELCYQTVYEITYRN
jgi:YD repeat-containing protein